MTDAEFDTAVQEGIDTLPSWVRDQLVNVMFLIRDEPTRTQRMENGVGENETLFGLYEGVPLSERGNESPLIPDTITLFRKPIFAAYSKNEDVTACIHNTIWHEVAHYFGHDEEWVEEEERKRGRIL